MAVNIRQKFVLTIIISVLFVAVFGWAYLSMITALGRADSNLAEVEAQIASLENERRQARNMDRLVEERGTDLKRIESFFVDHEHPLEFIEKLENLAKITGSQIALGVEGQNSAGQLTFRVTLDGLEQNIGRYLKLFELLPYESKIEELTLQKISGTGVAKTGGAEPDTRLTMVVILKTK